MYSVHEKPTPIEFQVAFNNSNKKKVDSLLKSYATNLCKKDGIKVEKNTFIICLPLSCNCFLVSTEDDYIKVFAFYAKNIQPNFWITHLQEIDEKDLGVIKQEVFDEVIKKAQ